MRRAAHQPECRTIAHVSAWRDQGHLTMVIVALLQQAAFDAETVQLLTAAFDRAWERVNASDPNADKFAAEARRILLAKYIIELGRRGEKDLDTLVDAAVAHLENSK
jgi:hypothetical protein